MNNRNYGQEITQNEWQLAWQNFSKLILTAFAIGVTLGFIWFVLFAPDNYFSSIGLYFWSWLYCKLPFGCSTNASYNLRALQPTMENAGGLLVTCRNITTLGTLGAAYGLNRYFKRKGEELEKTKIVRGSKLLTPGELKEEIAKVHESTRLDLSIGRELVRIPERLTYRHFSMSGASGTGKTQTINSILKQLQNQQNQKALILDLNGQYYSRFGKPEDKILSLYDKRSEKWDFWSEDAPPEFFAKALVDAEGGRENYFTSAGRALLTDLISLDNSIEELWQDLISSPQDLLPKLQGGISPAQLGAPEQAAGVLSTASLKFNFLRYLNCWSKDKAFFSLTDWATDPHNQTWIYIIVRDRDLAASEPLLRVWFDLATHGLLQRDAEKAERKEYPHIWLVADELAGLGKLPSLGKLLSQGRKYLGTLIVGYQTAAQIENIYGRFGAKEVLQGLQNKLVYRCSDPDTAKQSSGELGGDQDLLEVSKNIQFGKLAQNDRNSLNQSIKTRPTVSASEIQNLPDLTAYLKICNYNPSLIHFDYHRYEEKNKPTDCEIPNLKLMRNLSEAELPDKKEPIVEENYLDNEDDKNFLDFSETKANTNSETKEPDYDFDPENFLNL